MTVRKPQPPVDFRSPEPRTLEDLRKLVAYLRDQNAWLEYKIAAGGGGSAGVSSFKGRTGAVVPVAGDYSKSDVGLSNVTNDAQWASTLSAQISALGTKASLVAADVIPYEDSAASFAKKKATAADLKTYITTGLATGGGGWSTQYSAPPATPDALDDEFTSGSADLATRGWTIINSAGTTMTRVGVPSLSGAGALTTTQYRSALTGGGIAVQIANTAASIYKSISVACSVVGISSMGGNGASSSTHWNQLVLWDTATPTASTRSLCLNNNNGQRVAFRNDAGLFTNTFVFGRNTGVVDDSWAFIAFDPASKAYTQALANSVIGTEINFGSGTFTNMTTLGAAGFALASPAGYTTRTWHTLRAFRVTRSYLAWPSF